MMQKWPGNSVYRTGTEWRVAVVAACCIAAITVCGKSLKAAHEHPITILLRRLRQSLLLR